MVLNRMKNFRIIILIGFILIITFVVFSPCLKNNFVNWDDNLYVVENTIIQHLSLHNVKQIFTSYFFSNYQPLTILSYLFDYKFFKLVPFGYHLTSLILHLFNCFFVFWLIYIFSRRISVSFITTLLFGLHPLHVESVAWISERKDVLYALFFLASIVCYGYYLRERKIKRYYYSSLILFIAALLSKAMAITLPFVLFLMDYYFYRKPDKRAFMDKIPFFILSFIFGMVTIIGQYSTGVVRIESSFNFFHKIAIASYSVIFYLYKIFVPFKLSCIYPYSGVKDVFLLLYPFLVFIILLVAVIMSKKYTRKIVFGSSFFLITILPVLQFIPIGEVIVADRYVYIASIGIFYILAEGFFWLFTKKIKFFRLSQCLILAILIAMTSVLALLTWKRCKVWTDSINLWDDVLSKYSNVATAYNNRGEYFLFQGEYEKARSDFIKAIEISNGYPFNLRHKYYYLNLGNSLRALGRNQEAIGMFEQLLSEMEEKSNPVNFNVVASDKNKARASILQKLKAEVYLNLANINDLSGAKDKAIALYSRAIEMDSKNINAYYYLGVLYANLNYKEKAEVELIKAMDIEPTYSLAYVKLAQIYSAFGFKEELVLLYKKAIANNLDLFDAYYYVGNIFADAQKDRDAILLYKRAIEINPRSKEVCVNLGNLYLNLGRNREAIKWFKKALELDANLAVAYNNLSAAYYYEQDYDLAIKYSNRAMELGYVISPKLLELLKSHRERSRAFLGK